MFSFAKPRFSTFINDNRGATAIIFGLTVTVLCLFSGIAIDYSRYVHLEEKLQAAADAAALAAASSDKASDFEKETIAKKVFAANMTGVDWTATVPRVTINNDQITVNIDTALQTTLMRLANFNFMPAHTSATAALGQSPMDIFLVLDMSASLGIAADATERQRLMNLTRPWTQNSMVAMDAPNGCEFACHMQEGFEPGTETTYEAARAAGIRLREDVILDAAQIMLTDILDPSLPGVQSGDVRVGILGFSNNARWLTKPTSDLDDAKTAVMSFPNSERNDTLVDVALPWIKNEIENESANDHKVIVLVTDGVAGGKSMGFFWNEFDTRLCDTLKQGKTDLYVLEVKYEDQPGNTIFNNLVSHFYNRITPALQACASPNKFLSANDPHEIDTAFRNIAGSVVQTRVRLTN